MQKNLTLKSEELAKKGQMLTGRQALHMIYKEFQLDEAAGALYGIQDHLNIQVVVLLTGHYIIKIKHLELQLIL